jgi:MtN3 and saliva related transmembrane protein
MNSEIVNAIGLAAGALTTLSFMPQLVRIWQRRSARDISYTALLSFIAGISLWLWYGLLVGSMPVIIANAVSIALNLSILAPKIRHHEGA